MLNNWQKTKLMQLNQFLLKSYFIFSGTGPSVPNNSNIQTGRTNFIQRSAPENLVISETAETLAPQNPTLSPFYISKKGSNRWFLKKRSKETSGPVSTETGDFYFKKYIKI